MRKNCTICQNNETRSAFKPYTVDIRPIRTKTLWIYILRKAKEWNALPVSVFPEKYDLGVFKPRMNTLFKGRHVPSTASSLYIR